MTTAWTVERAARSRPQLVLIGSGDVYFRRYSLEDLVSEYDVWLLTARAPVWEREYVAGWAVVDFSDPGALVERASRSLPAPGLTVSFPGLRPSSVSAASSRRVLACLALTRQQLISAGTSSMSASGWPRRACRSPDSAERRPLRTR